jgi:thiol:disulfide interchange protein DsbA
MRDMRQFLATFLLFFVFGSVYADEEFIEGEHFERLPIYVEPSQEGVIDVVEVFSYGCIHCYNFDPVIERWAAVERENVEFRRLPAVFGKSWEPLARWFYVAEILEVSEKVHMPLFEAIHRHRLDIRDADLAAKLFENLANVDPQKFKDLAESFEVDYRIRRDGTEARKFRVTGVPTMTVGGMFKVDGAMAGSNARMLEVVDFLVQKIRSESVGSKQ